MQREDRTQRPKLREGGSEAFGQARNVVDGPQLLPSRLDRTRPVGLLGGGDRGIDLLAQPVGRSQFASGPQGVSSVHRQGGELIVDARLAPPVAELTMLGQAGLLQPDGPLGLAPQPGDDAELVGCPGDSLGEVEFLAKIEALAQQQLARPEITAIPRRGAEVDQRPDHPLAVAGRTGSVQGLTGQRFGRDRVAAQPGQEAQVVELGRDLVLVVGRTGQPERFGVQPLRLAHTGPARARSSRAGWYTRRFPA